MNVLAQRRSGPPLPGWARLRAGASRLGAIRTRHPVTADVLVAAAVALLCVPDVAAHPADIGTRALFDVALVLPLMWRRRFPVAVFGLLAAVAFAQWAADVRLAGDVALLIAMYTVAAHAPRVRAVQAWAIMELGALLATLRWAPAEQIKFFVALSGLTTAAAVLGTSMRHRRALLASLEERAARLELERDQQGRLSAAAERARIAREMHDIVAHNLTVIVALADGAVFAAERSPERARTAMENVSDTGRQALTEMRRLLGVLRDEDGAALAPQPGAPEVDALVEGVRAAGLPVTLELSGDLAALPAGVQLSVFRIVQEGLTNTLKHAGPAATAHVTLRATAGEVQVEVVDDGRGASGPGSGDGRGLGGMRERAAVYGGVVEAGPRPGRGWLLRARLVPGAAGGEDL